MYLTLKEVFGRLPGDEVKIAKEKAIMGAS